LCKGAIWNANQTEKPKIEKIAFPIEWHYAENQYARFANNLIVQFDDPEFHLSFFDVKPPLITGSTLDEQKKQIEEIGSIKGECVCRIVVSKERMPRFIKAMQENYDRHKALIERMPAKEERKAKGK
jgi:hypothetical protein